MAKTKQTARKRAIPDEESFPVPVEDLPWQIDQELLDAQPHIAGTRLDDLMVWDVTALVEFVDSKWSNIQNGYENDLNLRYNEFKMLLHWKDLNVLRMDEAAANDINEKLREAATLLNGDTVAAGVARSSLAALFVRKCRDAIRCLHAYQEEQFKEIFAKLGQAMDIIYNNAANPIQENSVWEWIQD
tara:strand:+ start:2181 stop:2741 length:561 start_codon:yes stop_codon:yes gene_type:complete